MEHKGPEEYLELAQKGDPNAAIYAENAWYLLQMDPPRGMSSGQVKLLVEECYKLYREHCINTAISRLASARRNREVAVADIKDIFELFYKGSFGPGEIKTTFEELFGLREESLVLSAKHSLAEARENCGIRECQDMLNLLFRAKRTFKDIGTSPEEVQKLQEAACKCISSK